MTKALTSIHSKGLSRKEEAKDEENNPMSCGARSTRRKNSSERQAEEK